MRHTSKVNQITKPLKLTYQTQVKNHCNSAKKFFTCIVAIYYTRLQSMTQFIKVLGVHNKNLWCASVNRRLCTESVHFEKYAVELFA